VTESEQARMGFLASDADVSIHQYQTLLTPYLSGSSVGIWFE